MPIRQQPTKVEGEVRCRVTRFHGRCPRLRRASFHFLFPPLGPRAVPHGPREIVRRIDRGFQRTFGIRGPAGAEWVGWETSRTEAVADQRGLVDDGSGHRQVDRPPQSKADAAAAIAAGQSESLVQPGTTAPG